MGRLTDALRGLGRSSFVRATALLAGSTAVGQAVMLAASPLLTRLFDPSEFGVLAVYASLLAMLLAVGSLRFEFAVPLPRRTRDAVNVLAAGWATLLVMTAATAVMVLLLRHRLAGWTGAPALASYLWFMPLSLLVAGGYQLLSYWSIREKRFSILGRTRMVQSVAMAVSQIGLGLAGWGGGGLVVGDVVGRSAGAGSLAQPFWVRRRLLRLIRWREMRRLAVRYRHFPLLASGASLLNVAALQLPGVLLAALYGPGYAGLFLLAQRVGGAPAGLVGQAMGQVFLGDAADAVRAGDGAAVLRRMRGMVRAVGRLGLVAVPLALPAPWVFAAVFGPAWREAGWFFLLLLPATLLKLMVSPMSQVTAVAERQGLQMAGDAVRAALTVAAFVVPTVSGAGAVVAVAGYGGVMAATYLGFLVMYLRIARRLAERPSATVSD